jgi:hypothetical protein
LGASWRGGSRANCRGKAPISQEFWNLFYGKSKYYRDVMKTLWKRHKIPVVPVIFPLYHIGITILFHFSFFLIRHADGPVPCLRVFVFVNISRTSGKNPPGLASLWYNRSK